MRNCRRRNLFQQTVTYRAFCSLALLGCSLTIVPACWAQVAKPTDYQVKAVYLYNFGRFVAWPGRFLHSQDPFTICVLGQDPFGHALDAILAGETISGRTVTAKRISSPQDSVNCQIVFLSAAENGSAGRTIEALNKHGILTVSDMPEFTNRGGMIQFVMEGKKVRFEVNLTAAQRAGLTLSSDLLKVATAVRRDPAPGE